MLNKNKQKDEYNDTIHLIQKSIDSYHDYPFISPLITDLTFVNNLSEKEKSKYLKENNEQK